MRLTFELRLKGLTFDEIGRELNLSHASAFNYYQAAMAERIPVDAKLGEELRNRQLLKLERTENKIFAMIQDRSLRIEARTAEGNAVEMQDFQALMALNAALVKNFEQAAKLAGAYKPTETHVTGGGAITDAVLAARFAELGGKDE
jgi:hypothetical protein